MDAPPTVHPNERTLRLYALGKLDDGSARMIDDHLNRCGDCRARVAGVSADSFLGRVRDAHPAKGAPARPEVAGTASYSHPASDAPAPPPADTLPPGLADHPDYQIRRELGRGGMGVVYLAHNHLMGRDEVLKVMGRQVVERPEVLDRFLREIRAVARLRHPNIVAAYSAVRLGPSIVFAMEYVEGLDLAKLVKAKGPLPVAHACNFAYQAALGLQHAHEEGLVHRDIKPGNLMLSRRGERATVKILDFGLAKATREEKVDTALTREGQALGTPDFIAPEQIMDAQSADVRADIYSLGGTLYYLLTGRPPFTAKSLYDIYQAHISRDADPLNVVRPEVPSELAALVAKMMAKEPARRFQTPSDVADALKPFFKRANAAFKIPQADASESGQKNSPRPVTGVAATPDQRAIDGVDRPEKAIGSVVVEPQWESLIELREPQASTESVPLQSSRPSRRRPRAPHVVLAAAALLLVVVALGIVIKIRSKDGSETVINVPPGAKVVVEAHLGKGEYPQPQGGGLTRARESGAKGQDDSPPSPTPRPVVDVGAPESDVVPRTSPPALRKEPGDLRASDALLALRRVRIPSRAVAVAGDGDAGKAPASLVGVLGEAIPIHNREVSSLAFSADGHWLASGSVDQTIILRETTSGRVHRVFRGHTGRLLSVVFSKDGRTLVSAGVDGTIRLWPIQKDGKPEILQPNLGAIWAMAASVDGRYLAAGGTKGAIKLWKWGQWDTPVEILATGGRVTAVSFSPDGELLASGWDEQKPEGRIRVYKAVDGRLAQTLSGHQKRVVALTFRPDGKALASIGSDRHHKVWDLLSGKFADFGRHNNWPTCLAYSPDGETLAVGVGWFVVLHGPLSQTAHGLDPTFPRALAFSPDGKSLALGAENGSVFVWDTASWRRQWLESGHPHRIAAVAMSGDGRTLLSGGDDFALRRWNLDRPGENEVFELQRLPFSHDGWFPDGTNLVAYSPDAQTFAAASHGLFVWDAATSKPRCNRSQVGVRF